MPRVKIASVGLTISSSSKEVEKVKAILEAFKEGVPRVMSRFSELSLVAARKIAPSGEETVYDKKGRAQAYKDPNEPVLRESISISKNTLNEFSLTVGGGGRLGIKAYMQEYGYPYATRFGPYKPNPKNHSGYNGDSAKNIRRVGYLRAGMIKASEALYTGKIDYSKTVRPGDVRNYEEAVTKNLNKVFRKLLMSYATGKSEGLPTYFSSKVPVPTEKVSVFASKFGSIKGLKISIPIEIELDSNVTSEREIQRGFNFLK